MSADGSTLVFTQVEPDTGMDIWVLPLSGGGAASRVVGAPGDQMGGTLSPDARWLAYVSDATGTWTVMLQDRASPERPARRVAENDGRAPSWSADGVTLIVPRHTGRSYCTVAEKEIDCRRHEVRVSAGHHVPYLLDIVLDWSRELAAQVPSPQQPARAVR